MIEEEMKVGPKGQVVIPKALRKALKIHPGSKVIFRLEGDRVVLQKLDIDAVSLFERIAKKGPSIKQISTHLYEEELEERVG
ncbi:AbrB/MazE/SpoVT family DNA-binding domain-containing protein [Candidatus Bathyarchaeota archaeon]|nr:AbrB/MazE/SpoVT family DNA-binding domain-containing protein [Candidatus Bathyarchaeota archaeon]MBS7629135.1 AbrB/MazE/SpoVT family DNA-binding domain-containing protein [Candidatus Bathyarchaeota archaeon]MBS7631922.1 AbrB/MazE/SpoVT family DNA-binding domain-containing protein [Candidatus Bathyarchaeota archaeon]